MQTDILIIGGGLTGLTAAFTLARRGRDVVVLEREARAGGQIQTHVADGFVFESGPNTGVVAEPEVAELFADLSEASAGKFRPEFARQEAKRRLIWKGGRFHALPDGPKSGLCTPLIPWCDKVRLLGEPWRAKGTNPDESVADLARRRLGKAFVDYAVDPFVSGIYAGNPATLVTRFALPKLYRLEQTYGSFIRGAYAKRRQPKSARDRLATKAVFSAVGGLESVPRALSAYLGDRVVCRAAGIRVHPDGEGWRVTFDNDGVARTVRCRRVVTTVGAYALPELLPFAAPREMEAISRLPYAPVVQVSVGVNDARGGDFQAFGGLVPSCEGERVLGVLFPAACFAERAPQGGMLFSFFLGGRRRPELIDLPDAEIEALVCDALHRLLGFPRDVRPDLLRIFRHRRAIPQYEADTSARLAAVARLESRHRGLTIAGNLRDGIGMAQRIAQARKIADALAAEPA